MRFVLLVPYTFVFLFVFFLVQRNFKLYVAYFVLIFFNFIFGMGNIKNQQKHCVHYSHYDLYLILIATY